MSSGDVFVSFGADTSGLDAALASAVQGMEAATAKMNESGQAMQAASKAAEENLARALGAVSSQLHGVGGDSQRYADQLKTLQSGLQETAAAHHGTAEAIRATGEAAGAGLSPLTELESIFKRIAAVAGISLSVDAVKSWVEDTVKAGDALDQAAARYGVALQDIQQLHGVAAIGGASGTELVSSLSALQTQLKKSSDDAEKTANAFKAIGLSFDAMKGKSPLELLNSIAGGFARYSDGVNKTAVANELLGESGVKLIRTLDLGRQGFAEIEAAALRAGGSMSDATVAALAQTGRDLAEMKVAWNSTMFAGVVPAIDGGVRAINKLLEAIDANAIQAALQQIADTFITFGGKVAEACVRASAAWDGFIAHITGSYPDAVSKAQAFGDKLLDVLNDIGQHGGAKYVDPLIDELNVKFGSILQKVGLATEAETQSWRNLANGVSGVGAAGDAAFGTLDAAAIKTELSIQKVRDATNSAREAFDRLAGAVSTAHSDAAMGGVSYYGNAPIRPGSPQGPQAGVIPADSTDDSSKGDNAAAGAVEKAYQAAVIAAQEAGQKITDEQNGLLQRHQITMAAWLGVTVTALAREQDAIQEAANKAIASDELSANQKSAIANREAQELKRLSHEIAQDQEKGAADAQRAWETGAAQIESAWNSNLRSLLSGQESFATAMKKTFADVVLQMIEAFEKFVVQAVLQYTVINNAAGVSGAIQAAAANTAAGGGIAALVANAAKAITIDAGQTFAGVAAFLSPVMGPAALGPAAAAQAAVTSVASADIGMWQVPRDMLTLVHHNELIMPAAESGALRSLLSNAAAGGGAGGARGGDTHNWNISSNASDPREVAKQVAALWTRNISMRPGY